MKMREETMKTLLTILSLAILGGCAVAPPGPPRPSSYGAHYPAPADPSQWRVVSVTPVAPGTGERLAANSGQVQVENSSSGQYYAEPIGSTAPAYAQQPAYPPQPAYAAPPLYAPAPYYAPAPSYYYPAVTFGLGLMFGHSWGGGHHGHYGHRGGHGHGGRGH
jgi:hypothetical protein